MIVHLQYHHRSEFDKVKMKCNLVQPVVQKPEGQRYITDAFQHLRPLPQSSEIKKASFHFHIVHYLLEKYVFWNN